MQRWLGFFLVGLLGAALPASAAQDEWPLKQVFGAKNVGMVQTSRNAVIEHCADDTCTRFMLAGAKTLPTLHDFAFLYLALVPQYDVEQTKGPTGERYFATVLKRQKGVCAGPDETSIAKCALASMAARYSVQAYISKMDEGWRRSEPFDLRAELTRAGIR
jgi:hypothetical protein